MTRLDRPWHRPGAAWYAARRLPGLLRPPVRVDEPPRGRWLWPRNPFTGQFPTAYQRGPNGGCSLHWGPDRQARLLVPVIP